MQEPRCQATIQALHADFNSTVKAGEVIAQIDPSTYDTALAEARANHLQAMAEAQRLKVEFDDLTTKAQRASQLSSTGLITQAELDAAQLAARQAAAALKAANANVRAAQAGVRVAEVNRSRTTSVPDGRHRRQPQRRSRTDDGGVVFVAGPLPHRRTCLTCSCSPRLAKRRRGRSRQVCR